MFHPQIKIFEDISPDDDLGKGRIFVSIFEKLPQDSNAIFITGFDLECLYKDYSNAIEKLKYFKCERCGFYTKLIESKLENEICGQCRKHVKISK